ncbi:peptidylprolyl isomerase [Geomonas sp. Red32]|uniref:peptidylprolyl isomerase n=1 Tax=Geomonas sp. Red32 TaxID=2912856 RepID=UPI00202CB135|nr:peptidylprolyl isomerase [Geomonas sp. Red32]MCM0083553.1 peptidylprolyl isomerase [Geomonas sp. Red32]
MKLARYAKKVMAVTVAAMTLAGCSVAASNVAPSNPGFASAGLAKAVARVNGTEITALELKRAEQILLANKPGMQVPPLLQKDFRQQALNQLISTELLFQASQKLKIDDLDHQAELKLAQVKAGFRDPAQYSRELEKIGMDERAFLTSIRRDLSIAYFVNTEIASKVTVTDGEIDKFYQDNPDKFKGEERVRASHILVAVDAKMSDEEKKAARQKAGMLRERVVKGEDFAKVAQEFSACPSSKQGGDLGYFGKGRMDPVFEKAAFALTPVAVSEVVESRYGFHVIKLVEKKAAQPISLAQARESIRSYLRTKKINDANEKFVGDARKAAKIDVML